MDDEIYTVMQAAQYLKVCDKTVRRLIKANKLTASKVGDRSWRIRKTDIDMYLQDNSNGMKGVTINE